MRSPANEAGYPVVRSMLEIWAEIAYLNHLGFDSSRTWQHRAWSLLVIADSTAGRDPEFKNSLKIFRERHAADFTAAEAKFRKRKTGHPSGLGRAALIRAYCGETEAGIYSYLSWVTHPITQGSTHMPFLDRPLAGLQEVLPARRRHDTEQDIALYAVRALSESWFTFHGVFGEYGRPSRDRTIRRAST